MEKRWLPDWSDGASYPNTVIRVESTPKRIEEKQKLDIWKAVKNFVKNRPAVGATLAAMEGDLKKRRGEIAS